MMNVIQEEFDVESPLRVKQIIQKIGSITDQELTAFSIKLLIQSKSTRRAEELHILRTLFSRLPFYQQFIVEHDHDALDFVLKQLFIERFNQNQILYQAGDPAYKIYTLLEGHVFIYLSQTEQLRGNRRHSQSLDYSRETVQQVRNKSQDLKLRNITKVIEYTDLVVFGESSIIEGRTRVDNALCQKACIIAILLKDDYQIAISMADRKKALKSMINFKHSPCFQGLNKKLLNMLLFAFQTSTYKYREIVYRQHQRESDYLYIVKEGNFVIYKYDQPTDDEKGEQAAKIKGAKLSPQKKVRSQIAVMTPGHLFGEQEAFTNKPRQETVECNSDQGIVIEIPITVLHDKLAQTNELYLLDQLVMLSENRNAWHKEFTENVNKVHTEFKNYFSATKPSFYYPQREKRKQAKMALPKQLEITTTLQDSPTQHLPRLKLITSNRVTRDDRLATPERYNYMIRQKFKITGRLHNLSEEQQRSLNLSTFQYQTVLVDKPKHMPGQTIKWPIQTNIYLNDLDQQSSHNSSKVYQNSSTSRSPGQRKKNLNRIRLLELILKSKTKPKRRNALKMGYKRYMEEQQMITDRLYTFQNY